MDDLTREFLLESNDGLDSMERGLNGLQGGADNAACISEIFRAVHTMKGNVGFLGFARLEQLAHAGEALLARLRDGALPVSSELIDLMMQLADRLRRILQLIEERGHEGRRDIDDDNPLIAVLKRAASGGAAAAVADDPADGLREALISGDKGRHAVESIVRVDVETLNRLMNLVGELVQTRNQFLQSEICAETFAQLGRRLDSVTANLRESVMQARMQPVGQLFQRFPRLARDVAASCGKRVKLELAGGETGLDKSLLEALKDPIAHAVRNAIDHGIELPQVRFPMGKPAEGRIELCAFHEGGQIVVEVKDDGAGIDCVKVVRCAVERGLLPVERALGMSDAEVMELLFEPGFSTSDEVTMISGRGVGMDVVRANVERIGGSVELLSVRGEGTTVRMRVPLTMAILPALIAHCGGQTFAVPHSALQEMVLVRKRDEERLVQAIGNTKVMRLRDRLIPLIDLGELLALDSNRPQGYYVAVLEAKGRQFGLIVDDVTEPQEIVVKPLSSALQSLNMFCGATILGDGQIALILDASGLARNGRIGEVAEATVQNHQHRIAIVPPVPPKTGEPMLVFADRAMQLAAVPLVCVERIERITSMQVEQLGGAPVLQYRGGLVSLEDAGGLMREAKHTREPWLVLICRRPGDTRKSVGLVVRDVLDVADGELLAGSTSLGEPVARIGKNIAVMYTGFVVPGGVVAAQDFLFQEAA